MSRWLVGRPLEYSEQQQPLVRVTSCMESISKQTAAFVQATVGFRQGQIWNIEGGCSGSALRVVELKI